MPVSLRIRTEKKNKTLKLICITENEFIENSFYLIILTFDKAYRCQYTRREQYSHRYHKDGYLVRVITTAGFVLLVRTLLRITIYNCEVSWTSYRSGVLVARAFRLHATPNGFVVIVWLLGNRDHCFWKSVLAFIAAELAMIRTQLLSVAAPSTHACQVSRAE